MFKGKNIFIRALEPTDLEFIYSCENDRDIWHVSNTLKPFSSFEIEQYILSSQDITNQKQVRFIICNISNKLPIGTIDLFDIDFFHQRAEISILVAAKNEKNKGFATESIELMTNYAQETLLLHQLYCTIQEGNEASLRLFKKTGFCYSGTRKDWLRTSEGMQDVLFYQKIL